MPSGHFARLNGNPENGNRLHGVNPARTASKFNIVSKTIVIVVSKVNIVNKVIKVIKALSDKFRSQLLAERPV